MDDATITNAADQLYQKICSNDWDGVMQILEHFGMDQNKKMNDSGSGEEEVEIGQQLKNLLLCHRGWNGQNSLHLAGESGAPVEIILKLIHVGGEEIVQEKIGVLGENALHCFASNSKTEVVILKLIEIGGRDIVFEKDDEGRNPLHCACRGDASYEVISKLIDIGGKDLVREKDHYGRSSLLCSCTSANASVEVLSKLIEMGGRDLIFEKDNSGRNAFHIACNSNRPPIEVMSELIEIGGKDLIQEKDNNGMNSFHYACASANVSVDLLSKIIGVGGGHHIFDKDNFGRNPLHIACEFHASAEKVSELIDIGGEDLVFDKNDNGFNPLQYAFNSEKFCPHKSNDTSSIEVISKLMEFGGRDLAIAQDNNGQNLLHYFCHLHEQHQHIFTLSNDILNIIIRQGGAEILTQMDDSGKTPLQFHIINETLEYLDEDENCPLYINNVSRLINKGIQFRIGGEYGIGGLFFSPASHEVTQNEMYGKWNRCVLPAIESIITQPHHLHLPLLHAVIINKAPPHIIKSTVRKFPESVNTTDSFGRLPIDVAVQRSLSRNNGMEEIITAFLSNQQPSVVFMVCIKNGLRWDDGMRSVVAGVGMDDIEREDEATCLYPFMLAGVGHGKHGFDVVSIFHLIKRSPLLVRRYDEKDEQDQYLRKRKRCRSTQIST